MHMIYNFLVKPLFDYIVSLILLILLSPLIFIIIILLGIQNKGKILFLQKRPGYKGKPFHIIKFKTMRDDVDVLGNLLPDEYRITTLGRIIRKCSLDEVLQLINVLKGDMSIVGPRPLLMKYLDLYDEEQYTRHDVLPGITGWAQVNGRNAISWDSKFKLDLEYLEKNSLWFDLKILGLTFFIVISRSDVNKQGHSTTDEFKGTSTHNVKNHNRREPQELSYT